MENPLHVETEEDEVNEPAVMMAQPPALPSAHDVGGRDSAASSSRSGVGCAPRTMLGPTQGRRRAGGAGDTIAPGAGTAASDGPVRACTYSSDSAMVVRRREPSGPVTPCDVSAACGLSRSGSGGMRAPISPSIVSGPPGDGRGRIGAAVTRETVRGHGRDGVRATIYPDTVFGPSWVERVRGGAPISPCIVSAVDDRSGHARGSSAAPSRSGRFPAGEYHPRMLAMGDGGGSSNGRQDEMRGGGAVDGVGGGCGRPGRSSTGGMANMRATEITGASAGPVPSQNRKKRPRTDPGGRLARGRRKGQLKEQAKTCHGCRNSSKAASACGGPEGSEEVCNYWLCKSCLRKWRDARGTGGAQRNTGHAEEGFVCCMHTEQLCIFGRNRVPTSRPQSVLRPSEGAKTRAVVSTVFRLPVRTTSRLPLVTTTAASSVVGTQVDGDVYPTTYSVCTSTSGLRVAVTKDKDGKTFLCSRGDCRTVENLRSAATTGGDTDTALPPRCVHAQAVHDTVELQLATPLLTGLEDVERALTRLPQEAFSLKIMEGIRTRARRAQEEGVPLLVGLGDTGWFAVRDSATFNRTVIGEWAHVKYVGRGSSVRIQCESNNGKPCGECSSKKRSGCCIHAAIVTTYVHTPGMEAEQDGGADGGADGVEYGPEEGSCGEEDGSDGERGVERGSASYTQQSSPEVFARNMAQLRMVVAIYRFPVEEPEWKEGTYGRNRISIRGCNCTACGRPYNNLSDADATLVAHGQDKTADLRVVTVERKQCPTCNLRGWAGDDIYEDGVFNYNGNVVIELRVLYQVRRAFRAGTPVSTWVKIFLSSRSGDVTWLKQNPILASRIADHNFHAQVEEAFYAFEALGEHPFDFTSYEHGYFPEILTIDGCAKVATDNVSTAQFEVARVDRVVDGDLHHQLAKISMISKMQFKSRLRFISEALPTFSPHNRISNLMHRGQRGKMPPRGSPEDGDVNQLLLALDGSGIEALSGKTIADLKTIFRQCFRRGSGIASYPTKKDLVQCLTRLWESSSGKGGGKCTKLFIERPSRSTAGVEGLFAADGVMYAHVFQILAESPADAVDVLWHLQVSPCLLITDIPCMIQPIADRVRPGLLQNGGHLPRGPDGVVSMPALQHVGRASRDAVNKYSLRVPPGGYPSPSLRQDMRQDNIYAAYAGAEPSPQVQPHVDFRELLSRTAVAAAGEGGLNRVGDVSYQGIRTLAEMHLDSLHQQGCYAMTLFDVVVVHAQWFAEGGRSGDEGHRGQAPGPVAGGRAAGDATPSELHIGEPPHREVGHGWRLPGPEVGGGGGGEAIPSELEGGVGGGAGSGGDATPSELEGRQGGGAARVGATTSSELEGGGGGGVEGMGDATPSEDDLSRLSQSECQSISTFLTKVLAVEVARDATPSELHIGEPPHQEVGHGWRLPGPEVGGGGGGEAIPSELEGGVGGGAGSGGDATPSELGGRQGGGAARLGATTSSELEGGGGGGAEGMGDATPSEDDLSKLSQSECQSISTFLTKVLAVAVGSTSTGGIVISAPPFLSLALHKDHQGAGGPTLRPLGEAVGQYHMRKVSSIAHRLGAVDSDHHDRAYRLIQGGVGFGVQEHTVKALQIALSSDGLGGGLDEEGRIRGYIISFNFNRRRSLGEYGHFYEDKRVGIWLGPDGPHEGNHQGPCQQKYGGLGRCRQLTGVNGNVHEQNHAKKTKYLPSVSGRMGFDTFTFNVTLINELENASINRKTCDLAVRCAMHHNHHHNHACCVEVWTCGRCFCEWPLMRSFDKLGKLRITRLVAG